MSDSREVRVPDIGEFSDVEIIEVHVASGDTVAAEDALITLESDKAAMEVPAPFSGVVEQIHVAQGGKVSEGDLIATLRPSEAADAPSEPSTDASAEQARSQESDTPVSRALAITAGAYDGKVDREAQLVVLGSGPGGYTAAFRAADLGLDVTLVERWPMLGGVCLNVGCIPSKALLHAAKVIEEAEEMAECGIRFGEPQIDADALRDWKNKIVGRLTGGLDGLAKQRKVKIVRGTGAFVSPQHLEVRDGDTRQVVAFEQCIIAAGSEAVQIPGWPEDPRIIDSAGALELDVLPERMLVVGGGIIGLEMATVYAALGVEVHVVELMDQLMPGCDKDLLRPLEKRIKARYGRIMTGTKVTGMAPTDAGIEVNFHGRDAPDTDTFGLVLVAVGRAPNGDKIAADQAGVSVNERGFIPVDKQMRTNVPHIFAIGDIVGQPMLAHKATHEAKVAAEVAAGQKRAFDARVIPSVAYTDPEVAWVGLTETRGQSAGRRLRSRQVSVGRQRPFAVAESRRGHDEDPVRSADRARDRCRYRRSERRRSDRRGRPRDRDGLRSRRSRSDRASAPDAVRDRRDGGRGFRRNADRPVRAEAQVIDSGIDVKFRGEFVDTAEPDHRLRDCRGIADMDPVVAEISWSGLALAFVPALIAIAILWRWSAGTRTALYATLRMLLQLLLIGYVLVFIFDTDSLIVITAVLAFMLAVSAWIAIRTLDTPSFAAYRKALLAITVGGVFTLALVTQGVLAVQPWFSPRHLVPLAGMIFASAMNAISLAGERFQAELEQGCSHKESRRTALQAALIPVTNALFAVGLVSLPGMMTGQILSGVSPLIAAKYQIVVMTMLFGAGGISAALFLFWIARADA